jgi:2-polyprenyl-3-methyl-5-hydroxy-6-metoxy-1,4-benzoquinol methylase
MSELGRQDHWQKVYSEKGEYQVSWFQEQPAVSLDLIHTVGTNPNCAIIDIGGGASRLVDALVDKGYRDVTVLDLSESAVSIAKGRLGERAAPVNWIVADVTQWQPSRQYDLWHDRAAFHFLTETADQKAYVERLTKALRVGGHAIIGTFAIDGPQRCSGLPVIRYDDALLSTALGRTFACIETRRHDHKTPAGVIQRFQFSVFERV